MNKKIGILIGVIVLGMIFVVSDINFDDQPVSIQPEEPEEPEEPEQPAEPENLVIMPVKSARPDCGPNDDCYIPSKITIKPGETVYWQNQDAAFHYDYYCTLHPWMKGAVLVER